VVHGGVRPHHLDRAPIGGPPITRAGNVSWHSNEVAVLSCHKSVRPSRRLRASLQRASPYCRSGAREREQMPARCRDARVQICQCGVAAPARDRCQYALLRACVFIALLAIVLASCSSAHKSAPIDAAATLMAASTQSGMASFATLRGAMTAGGKDQVVVSGEVDFKDREAILTLAPSPGVGTYPPYEARFVDGWSYVEIDPAVRRPPTVRADARWIAFHEKPAYLPVPDRSLPPELPISLIGLPRTQPAMSAQFIDPPGTDPRRLSARFGRGIYSSSDFTYGIDRSGRIVSVSDVVRSDEQGSTFTFVYGTGVANVVAPSGEVQRLTAGENLYPTPTTASTP
jgi:hypothetical protein